ncbi:MAG: hypothetical protein N3C63_08390 [Rhodocyclaceae bacterium]|nr:hypothetical protein [Rhodocyclaceae bacterium]
MRRLLAFLRSEVWTSLEVAADVMKLSCRKAAARTIRGFVDDGLVVTEEVVTSRGRVRLVGITTGGQAWISGLLGKPLDGRVFERGRVGLTTLQHRVELQKLRICCARAGWAGWQYPDRQPAGEKNRQQHRADAIAVTPIGRRAAIEMEMTVKSRKRYRFILGHHLQAIQRGEYDEVIYSSPSPELLAAVRQVVLGLDRVVVGGREVLVTPEMLSKFHFLTTQEVPNVQL